MLYTHNMNIKNIYIYTIRTKNNTHTAYQGFLTGVNTSYREREKKRIHRGNWNYYSKALCLVNCVIFRLAIRIQACDANVANFIRLVEGIRCTICCEREWKRHSRDSFSLHISTEALRSTVASNVWLQMLPYQLYSDFPVFGLIC